MDFIRKVRYTVTVQSYADLFQEDACIQMELQILLHKMGEQNEYCLIIRRIGKALMAFIQ